MTRRLLIMGSIVIGALIQLFLPTWSALGGIKPPVLATMVLYYALQHSTRNMWLAVFLAALLHDSFDLGGFGPALLGFPAIALLAHRVRLEIFVDGLVTQVIFGAFGAMLAMLIAALVYAITGQRPFHFGLILLRILGAGVLGAITLPVVSQLLKKIEATLPRKRGYNWQ
jgi:rod shape-determining protein MreD